MITILLLYFFLLGLIIGSFLNVIILRFNTGRTIGGRSSCMSCKTQLTWRELIPVFSFLFQKGRCKTCKVGLKWQYPLVELVTGLLFALNFYVWLQNGLQNYLYFVFGFAITTIILALYVVIFVYDMRHKIIPDLFSFIAWGLSIVYVLSSRIYSGISLFYYETPKQVRGDSAFLSGDTLFILEHILSGLFFYFIIWVIWKISKGRMIGLGDAKLFLSIGTILGFVYTLSALFFSVWIAMIYIIYILLKQYLSRRGKHITMKTEIPFGPFLILGFLIVYFTHIDVTNISLLLESFS